MLRCFFRTGVDCNNKWRAICCGIFVFLLLEYFMARTLVMALCREGQL